jgi:hypothetical protein
VEESPLGTAASATRDALRHAFPESIRPTVERAVEVIEAPSRAELGPRGLLGKLVVDGERVAIPYRIYASEPRRRVATSLDDEAKLVLGCCYTRHNDGYLRERAVLSGIGIDRAWIVPFVVQLLGEYVVQISERILERFDELRPETYHRFAAANEPFMRLTRGHIVSYWACYYRADYRLPSYPPVRVLMELGLWNGREGRHHLAGRGGST